MKNEIMIQAVFYGGKCENQAKSDSKTMNESIVEFLVLLIHTVL